jgi:transcriptional regulator with XRE-family HTH domain
MKLSDIPAHIGISAQHLADLMGTTRQALNNYTSGRKNKPSKFIGELLAVSNLNLEEIIFPDIFDHPDGENNDHPAYWANVAIEALKEAKKRGMEVEKICNMIVESATPKLSNL